MSRQRFWSCDMHEQRLEAPREIAARLCTRRLAMMPGSRPVAGEGKPIDAKIMLGFPPVRKSHKIGYGTGTRLDRGPNRSSLFPWKQRNCGCLRCGSCDAHSFLRRLRHAGLADRRDVPVVGAAAAAQDSHRRKRGCQPAVAPPEIVRVARVQRFRFVQFGMAFD